MTPLHVAVTVASDESHSNIRDLIGYGADIHCPSGVNNQSPFQMMYNCFDDSHKCDAIKESATAYLGQVVVNNGMGLVEDKRLTTTMIEDVNEFLNDYFMTFKIFYSLRFWKDRMTPVFQQFRAQHEEIMLAGISNEHLTVQRLDLVIALFDHIPPGFTSFVSLDYFKVYIESLSFAPRVWTQSKFAKFIGIDFGHLMLFIQFLRVVEILARTEFGSGLRDLSKSHPEHHILLRLETSSLGPMITIFQVYGIQHLHLPHNPSLDSTNYSEGMIPPLLQAAFLGPRSYRVTKELISAGTSLRAVAKWIEEMDASIFSWSMGLNAPLSFTRAFETFRAAGCDVLQRR
ncbi:hypothetical protein EDB80DRAFT_863155 [Ilyonectria destructans]|nr:hypothetical protein EDB80DRAFT_863155 [Ilyonectria destructans]